MFDRTSRQPIWLISLALIVIALYPVAAGWLLLNPDGWQINRLNVQLWMLFLGPFDLLSHVTPEEFATGVNALLFMPLVWALWVLKPSWLWVAMIVCLSTGVELYQWWLGTRDATIMDVATNSVGAVLGALAGSVTVRIVDRGPRAASPRNGEHPDLNGQSNLGESLSASVVDSNARPGDCD